MLNGRIRVVQINYETNARNLAERFMPELVNLSKEHSMINALLLKLEDSMPEVLVFLMRNFTDDQKALLLCEMANRYI